MIDVNKIKENLRTSQIGGRIFFHDNIDSTNTEALRHVNSLKAKFGDLIIAKSQYSGMGQQNNNWNSPEGGLYISIITVSKVSEFSNLITFAAGVACINAIKSVTKINATLKWVNDIIYKGNKLGGILTQSVTRGNLSTNITGIGINTNIKITNINNNKYNAVSLSEIIECKVDMNILIPEICNYFEKYFELYQQKPDEIINKWLEYSNIKDSKINFISEDSRLSGIVESIDKSGYLIVNADNKIYKLTSSKNIDIL
jgi:BirA family biotin operon repressor/biotin-[acetyl-CoA-carboxylase] ligase